MSKYTTQVRYIVETCSDPDMPVDEQITAAAPKIFNFDFPIWNESDRLGLEESILLHYFTQEIGFETVGLWKLKLKMKLREIMPYYIELWKTTQREIDYLNDVDITEEIVTERDGGFTHDMTEAGTSQQNDSSTDTGEQSSNTTENGTMNKSTNSNTVNSDLPQVVLSGVTDVDYANNQQLNTGKDDTTAKNSVDTTAHSSNTLTYDSGRSTNREANTKNTHTDNENRKLKRTGLTGSRSSIELLQQYRQSLLQIPRMIIQDLSDLFMAIW